MITDSLLGIVAIIYIISLLAASFFYFVFSLRTHLFFSLDDFAVLAYFKSHSVSEMISQFFFHGDIWGFHKILGYLDLRFLFDLFGVWPLPYIINNQLLHSGNLILLFLIISRLSKDNFKAFFFSLIFNSLYLYYFSNVHEYLVTFLSLLSIYLYLKIHHRQSLICFLLALLTKELALSVPLFLFSITFFQRKEVRPLFPFFSLAVFYLAYQLAFLPNPTYATSTHPTTIWRNFRFYLSTPWLTIISASLIFAIRRRTIPFLIIALLALSPALILANRQETYYLYLPLAYLCLYLALTLPSLRPKTAILFLAIFLFLGGRKLLPPIARQDFTNWQKDSISRTLESIAAGEPLNSDKLERDARLMIETNTFDLFLPKVQPAVY